WTRDMFGTTEAFRAGEAGTYFEQFEAALQTWVVMSRRAPTVAEAALTFNVAPALVIEACSVHPWMFIVDNRIELEGK
ncbi:MAG: hypothetical protein NW200_12485, partial [Hyphomonadaceae bacterium]|nr:hypothetical protein [Hyphomonadaceae bacterium]